MTAPVEAKITVPYGAWPTMLTFIQQLNETVMPPVIDSSVMSRMSGSARSETKTSLRFLRWTTDTGAVTPAFKGIVNEYNTPGWKMNLAASVREAYAPVINDLDIESATLRQLMERFRDNAGVSGSVLRKAIRFFLAISEDAGLKLSPHFNVRGLTAMTADRAKPKASSRATQKPATAPAAKTMTDEVRSEKGKRHEFPIPGLTDKLVIYMPEGITLANWEFVAPYIRAFIEHDDRARRSADPFAEFSDE